MDNTNPSPEETPVVETKTRKINVEKVKSGAKKFALGGGLLIAGFALGRSTASSNDVDDSTEETTES